MQNHKKIAIITGASSGIGREFVRQISEISDVEEIWIIARRKEILEEMKEDSVLPLVPLALDLTRAEDISFLEKQLQKELPEVQILVNAAGMGKLGPLEEQTTSSISNMIDLNCKALSEISQITIPFMVRGSRLFEISSIASFQPIPNFSIYSASKAFVTNLSLSLSRELKPRGIQVVCVCPYWIKDTGFIGIADNRNYFHRMPFSTHASLVVRKALQCRGTLCTPDPVSSLERIASRLLPSSLTACLMEKVSRL